MAEGQVKPTFQGSMEAEATKPDDQIANKANEKDSVVVVSNAIGNTFVCQVYKGYISEGVDDLSAVYASIIILQPSVCQLRTAL